MKFFRSWFLIALIYSYNVSASDWKTVYLASFPRSGNHWMRFLIEEATGIATSSVYRDGDYPHLPDRFPWGGYSTDHGYTGTRRYPTQQEPVVLKTHYPCFDLKLFPPITELTVCLVRNPIDAFYSYHVYRAGPGASYHISLFELRELIKEWRTFYEFWDRQPGVIFIRYEDLYQDPAGYLSKITHSIGYETSPEDIQRAINRYPPRGGLLKHIQHYRSADIELIKSELSDLLSKYDYCL